jgi:hypothetical protein
MEVKAGLERDRDRENSKTSFRNPSQGCKVRCASNHLIVSVYRVLQMQGVGRADVLSYFKCLADAVPSERLPSFRLRVSGYDGMRSG